MKETKVVNKRCASVRDIYFRTKLARILNTEKWENDKIPSLDPGRKERRTEVWTIVRHFCELTCASALYTRTEQRKERVSIDVKKQEKSKRNQIFKLNCPCTKKTEFNLLTTIRQTIITGRSCFYKSFLNHSKSLLFAHSLLQELFLLSKYKDEFYLL